MKTRLMLRGFVITSFLTMAFMLPTISFCQDHYSESFEKWYKKTGNGTIIKGSPAHTGHEVDIDGKIGDKVKAYKSGKVIKSDNNPNNPYGRTVIIKDDSKNTYRYSHLDKIDKKIKEGKKVDKGDTIGTIGNTGVDKKGHSTTIPGKGGDGSHLHFEKRDKNGNSVVP